VVFYLSTWGMKLSTPFEFFYNGPLLAADPNARRVSRVSEQNEILAALAHGLSDRMAHIEMEAHPNFEDGRAFQYAGWQTQAIYTHIWEMQCEALWAGMTREKRREIRRAEEVYTFSQEEEEAALDAFLPLYHQTMRKFSWRPSLKWETIFKQRFAWMRLRDGCRFYTARAANGEMAGGVVALLSREDQTAYLWRQGSQTHQLGLVSALYWRAACDLADEFPQINFGGSPQFSLSQFKDYLGARAVPHLQFSKRNSRYKLPLLETAYTLKDQLYNLLMRVAYRPWQRLRHGRYGE